MANCFGKDYSISSFFDYVSLLKFVYQDHYIPRPGVAMISKQLTTICKYNEHIL